jgi:hypothetical protein
VPRVAAGVQSQNTQTRFEATFEQAYSASSLLVPWYITAGYTDWEGNVTGAAPAREPATGRRGNARAHPNHACVWPPSPVFGAAQLRVCAVPRLAACSTASAVPRAQPAAFGALALGLRHC